MSFLDKKSQKCSFWPRKKFQPNWSKKGQKMAKRRFLGPKSVEKVVFGPEIILAKSVKKWLKKGQKLFSRSKRVENVVFCPYFFKAKSVTKWPKYGHTHGVRLVGLQLITLLIITFHSNILHIQFSFHFYSLHV